MVNYKKSMVPLLTGLALICSQAVHAGNPKGGNTNASDTCPAQAVADMDSQFGVGTSDLTSCIEERSDLKSVIAWNLATINSRTGLAQQVQVTRNSANNYENIYGMQINKDFELVAIGYAGGGRWLISDEAYNRSYGVSTGNPSSDLVESLIARGIKVYMCQNTMRGNGWQTADLLPGVLMVPSGAVGIMDYEHRGYQYINP